MKYGFLKETSALIKGFATEFQEASKGIKDKYIKETIGKIKDENEDQDFFSAIKICKKTRVYKLRSATPLFL